MEYYFIGDSELVTAFRFIGIDGTAVHDHTEAEQAFKTITDSNDCKVLIMTEETASWLDESIVSWQLSGNYPLIVEIPGIMGKMPARKTITEAIREAIGINI